MPSVEKVKREAAMPPPEVRRDDRHYDKDGVSYSPGEGVVVAGDALPTKESRPGIFDRLFARWRKKAMKIEAKH